MDLLEYLKKIFGKWESGITNYFPKILLAILLIVLFYFLGKLAKRITVKISQRIFNNKPEVSNILASVVFFFFLLSGLFLAMEVLNLEGFLSKMIAGAGIVGIVAGFAFKDIASNAFAGLLLKVQHPFNKGDWVTLDGTFGTVVEVGWITTSVKTISGQEVFVPNQIIYNHSFTNFSAYGKRRVILKSGVSYGDDLDLVEQTAKDVVKTIPSVLPDEKVDFYFTEIGDSTYNFEVRFWIEFHHQEQYLYSMSELIKKIKKEFENKDISIAYSVTTLDFGVKGGVNLFDKEIGIKS